MRPLTDYIGPTEVEGHFQVGEVLGAIEVIVVHLGNDGCRRVTKAPIEYLAEGKIGRSAHDVGDFNLVGISQFGNCRLVDGDSMPHQHQPAASVGLSPEVAEYRSEVLRSLRHHQHLYQ